MKNLRSIRGPLLPYPPDPHPMLLCVLAPEPYPMILYVFVHDFRYFLRALLPEAPEGPERVAYSIGRVFVYVGRMLCSSGVICEVHAL